MEHLPGKWLAGPVRRLSQFCKKSVQGGERGGERRYFGLAQAGGCTGAVIAPGGSAVCRAGAIGHLRALGRVVYLHVPLSELERRIHNITTRGIAMAPGQTLADVYAAREPLYRRYADLTVDVGEGRGLEETVAAVLQGLLGLNTAQAQG